MRKLCKNWLFRNKELKRNVNEINFLQKKSLSVKKTLQKAIDGLHITSSDIARFLRIYLHHNLDFHKYLNPIRCKMSAGIRITELVPHHTPKSSHIASQSIDFVSFTKSIVRINISNSQSKESNSQTDSMCHASMCLQKQKERILLTKLGKTFYSSNIVEKCCLLQD